MKKIIQWYYGKASIRRKLVISYLLLVTIPILVLGFYSFSVSKKNLEEQTHATMTNNIVQMTVELGEALKRENDNIKYLAYNAKFRQTLKNSGGNTTDIAQVLNEVVEPIFWYFITSDRNLKGIEIYSPYISSNVGSFLKPVGTCINEPWYQYHLSNHDTLWTYEDGELFATRTLLDAPTSSENIGVLKMNVYPDSLFEPLDRTDYLDNGILILDAERNIVYEKPGGSNEISDEIQRMAKEGKREKLTHENGSFLLLASDVPESDWSIYYYVSKDAVSSRLNAILRSTLLVVGICLVVLIGMVSVLSRVLSRRILELKDNAEKVAEGRFDLNIYTGYTDEIGTVAKSLQMMNDRLKEMIARVYKTELEKRVMELKALQAMINPHFLYNCLSSIKWKAIRSGNDEISDLTGVLAKFYRTSLNGGKQITTVEQELVNIKSYIELQQMVRDKPFQVEYQIKEEGLSCAMPNFLLQPLVENAIEHGINCLEEEDGKLTVEFQAGQGTLCFKISNNGPVMELEHLEQVLNTPGKGYGIFYIQERIRIYYGDGYGLKVRITEDGITCFTVTIRDVMDEAYEE